MPRIARCHDGFPLKIRCVQVEISTKPYHIADYSALGSNHSANSLQPIGGGGGGGGDKNWGEINFLVCVLSANSLLTICE